jgi:mono/diheme cytochrome c family protein
MKERRQPPREAHREFPRTASAAPAHPSGSPAAKSSRAPHGHLHPTVTVARCARNRETSLQTDAWLAASLAHYTNMKQWPRGNNRGCDAVNKLRSHRPSLDRFEGSPLKGRWEVYVEFNEVLRVCAIAAAILAAFLVSTGIQANASAVQRGRAFAQSNCARCHAIGSVGQSPLPKAPPFRTLHERYPVEDLAESLAEGIRTGHRAMPEFALDENQIRDLLSYLKSLELEP